MTALRGTVLQDGHVDPYSGPRCMVKMSEGPRLGLYVIADTDVVLTKGTEVLVSGGRATKRRVRVQAWRLPDQDGCCRKAVGR